MPFEDFLHQFSDFSICRIVNTSIFSLSKTWHENRHFGRWQPGPGRLDRAGGCLNNPDKVLNNPQLRYFLDKHHKAFQFSKKPVSYLQI